MTGIKRALLIGINYIGTSSELAGCIQDIRDVETYLKQSGYTQFTILDDKSASPSHRPTRENITAAIKSSVRATAPGDMLYVHYSGHGTYSPDQSGDEIDSRDECICPVDMKFIADDTLHNILVKPLVQGAKLRVVFDSCHSGSCLDLPYRWVAGTTFVQENTMVNKKDIIFISGCRDDQYSADATIDGHANGALTWALLRSLRDMGKSGTSTHSWKDLGEMIRSHLREGGYDQVPQICMESRSQLQNHVDII